MTALALVDLPPTGARIETFPWSFSPGVSADTGPKISPAEQTLTLLKEGKSLAEIAVIRDRRIETIYSTLCTLVEQGKIGWHDSWMPDERRKMIEEAARQQGFERAKPIKEVLPEDISYDEIRLVLAELKRTAGPG